MSTKGFSQRELHTFRKLALDAIALNLSRGFNYYPDSVELAMADSIVIPVKFGHRNTEFINLLEKAVCSEFKKRVENRRFPRTVVYQWLKNYEFPKPEEKTRIYDISQGRYVQDEADYKQSSNNLIAEGAEFTLVFKPQQSDLVDVVRFISRKGNLFLTDNSGSLIPADAESPLQLNPERLSDSAYMTPMIITSYDAQLEKELPAFRQVKKLYKIKGKEEISTYVDKTLNEFVRNCRIQFKKPILRLANKLFKDFINYEDDPRLASG